MRLRSLLLLAALTGCGSVCTSMYVPDRVDVSVARSAAWAPGLYRVEAAGDACEVTLPLAQDAARAVSCASTSGPATFIQLTVDTSGVAISSLRYGSAAPSTLEVKVQWNGIELTRQTLTPAYSTSEPNGPGCGVTRSGTARVSF